MSKTALHRQASLALAGAVIAILCLFSASRTAAADASRHLDLQATMGIAEARSRCAPALIKAGEICVVGEFGGIGTVAGRVFSYARYDFRAAPEVPAASLPYSRIVIFESLPSAIVRPILVSGDDPAFSYPRPKLLRSGGRILLHIPATENGSGNFNRETLYVWRKGGWRDVDVTGWLEELARRLPHGLDVRQGVYPNYATMTAATPLWRDQDGPRCGTGGRAEIGLRWQDDRIAVSSVRTEAAGECGEPLSRGPGK